MMEILCTGSANGRTDAMIASRFVIRGDLFLALIEYVAAALRPEHHFFDGADEIVLRDLFAIFARSKDGRFIHEVGEIGAGESRRALGDDRELHVGPERLLACVNFQDIFAVAPVRQVDDDAPVESPRAHERGIKDVGPVARRHNDDFLVRLEAIHLHEDLIERLLALVVAAAHARAAHAAHGIYLIYEYDRGSGFLRDGEKVAHARGADADEHLDELGAGYGEERHARFTRDSPREQGFPGAGGTHQEHALGDARADLDEFLGVLEEVDDLGELRFCFPRARDVGERHFLHLVFRRDETRHRFAECERLHAARLHLPREIQDDAK